METKDNKESEESQWQASYYSCDGGIYVQDTQYNLDLSSLSQHMNHRLALSYTKPLPVEGEEEELDMQNLGKVGAGGLTTWDLCLMNLLEKDPTDPTLHQQCNHLNDVFIRTAETYSKALVAEIHIPSDMKKIPPVNAGGIAGGSKFEIHGLFFKYPKDTKIGSRWLYGGVQENHLVAAKAANHDFTGMTQFRIADQNNFFNTPLYAIADYQGYRLTVMTTIPVSERSLVYGSCDAGRSMCNNNKENKEIHSNLQCIGKRLNLRPHFVTRHKVEVPVCGDLEIHQISVGTKELYFGLDMARLFPPCCPLTSETSGSIYYQLFRPEFLKSLPYPLSSDVFTSWQSLDPQSDEMNTNARQATLLLRESIGNYSKSLEEKKLLYKRITRRSFLNTTRDELIHDLHSHGINLRYSGLLLSLVSPNYPDTAELNISDLLFSIIVVRTLKNMWRRIIRVKTTNKNQMVHSVSLDTTLQILNKYLLSRKNPEDASTKKFLDSLWDMAQINFGVGVIDDEEISSFKKVFQMKLSKFNDPVLFKWILLRFCNICGISLSTNCIQQIEEGNFITLSIVDISSFNVQVKCPPFLDYYSGIHYLNMSKSTDIRYTKTALLRSAEHKLFNVINYPFPNILDHYAEAAIGLACLDRNAQVPLEKVLEIYEAKLIASTKGTTQYLENSLSYFLTDYLMRIRDFTPKKYTLDQLQQQYYSFINRQISFGQTNKITDFLMVLLVPEIYSLFVKEKEKGSSNSPWLWFKRLSSMEMKMRPEYEKKKIWFFGNEIMNILEENPEIIKKFFVTVKELDMEKIQKQYIVNFFRLQTIEEATTAILRLCSKNIISFADVSELFQFPLLTTIYEFHVEGYKILKENGVKDRLFSGLMEKFSRKRTPIHSLIKENGVLPLVWPSSYPKKFRFHIIRFFTFSFTKNTELSDREALLDILLENGANIDELNEGLTPLHVAINENYSWEVIDMLLKRGADISAITPNGDTSLHLACRTQNLKLIQYLYENGGQKFLKIYNQDLDRATDLLPDGSIKSQIEQLEGNTTQYATDVNDIIAYQRSQTPFIYTSPILSITSPFHFRNLSFLLSNLKKSTALTELTLPSCLERSSVNFIVSYLKQNTTLKRIDLSKGNFTSEYDIFFPVLEKNSTLTSLNLTKNGIPENTPSLCYLFRHKGLIEVDLSSCNLNPKNCEYLFSPLKQNNCLRTLNLSDNVYGTSFLLFSEILRENTTLTHLDLSYGDINDEGLNSFSEGIKVNQSLKFLSLSANKFTSRGLCHLVNGLSSNTSITTLDLKKNVNVNYDNWGSLLQPTCSITYLNLDACPLKNPGVASIGLALKSNNTISHLSIYDVDCGPEGAKFLAEGLKLNVSLKELNIGCNLLQDEGCSYIMDALTINNSLNKITIYTNKITGMSGEAISNALKLNTTLTTLNLSNNALGKEGAACISSALLTNTVLLNLYLNNNSIGSEGAQTFCDVFNNNSTLTFLSLEVNGISMDTFKLLRRALNDNNSLKSFQVHENDYYDDLQNLFAGYVKSFLDQF